MPEFISLLKSKHALLIFLVITSIYGWNLGFWWEHTIKKYNPLTIVIVEIIIAFFILIGIIILTQKHSELYQEISKITPKDYGYLTLIGFTGLIFTYLGTSLFLYHSVEDIRLSDFIISIFIDTIAVYIFTRKKFTKEIILGLILVIIGGFFIVK